MACRECLDICKVRRVFILVRHLYTGEIILVKHLATKLQRTNYILSGYITNSRDHGPLSKTHIATDSSME